MPTFRHASFIRRALESLLAQTMEDWELIVFDDGSPDRTAAAVADYLGDSRIRYHRSVTNLGLGAALNRALDLAAAEFIAYLPSDDIIFPDHLSTLLSRLEKNANTVLSYSGIKYEYRVPGKGVISHKTSTGQIDGHPLQLVQVLHRRTDDRWMERRELETDDLDSMFWSKLRVHGHFVGTEHISCEWVDHPHQRHKIMQEPLGGINPYRSYYGVQEPLRYHTSKGNVTDEVEHYRRFRKRPDTPPAADGMKILLVGELAFNPERVLALEERGHTLYGLWTPDGHWFNSVGPMPFGHVTDVSRENWRAAVREIQPDVIYAMLNWEAVPFAHQVLTEGLGIPFAWHFKEGPFDCIANGTWPMLLDLYKRSHGQIYSTPEMRDWFQTVDPDLVREGNSLVLDGDLPKQEWFGDDTSPRLSEMDGEVHTVVAGGPIGLEPALVAQLAASGIHLHFYGDFHRGQWPAWTEQVQRAAGRYFHIHPQVDQERWVSELSQYDAGWLHLLKSGNQGNISRADWGDLNYPARIATYLAAGLPIIQLNNSHAIVATQSLARKLDIGLFLEDVGVLRTQLEDRSRMEELRRNAWQVRREFTFDYHADQLITFFRQLACGAHD